MTERPDEATTVWQEVRRRRVVKVVVAYIAAAFAGFEVVLYLTSQFEVAEWIGRALLGAIVLGFPVSVVLAWTYDLTPGGVVRTPDEFGSAAPSEPTKYGWIVIAAIGVALGLIVRGVRG